ncbi:MAG: diacylglycerol/lipid kinase family protein [Omnitrophica WOR_2 bacterium]
MRRSRVILNPAAGHGNGLRAKPRIEHFLAGQGLAFDLVQTQFPGHAIELARQAVEEGADAIVAAGGDGTVNEVINGLMQSGEAADRLPYLGVLCVGRGNDFSSGAGIPADLEKGCQALRELHTRRIDIGRVSGGKYPEGRYFANCVGVGFDAIGTIEVSKLPRWGGFASFVFAIFKTIFLYNHAPLATIEYGDQCITQRSLMISIMNGRRLGGGFIMAPDSKMDDGLLDICIAGQMSSLQIIRLLPHFTKGTQATQKTIKTGQASKITITAQDGPLPSQTDGEIISTDGMRLEVELLPRQIEIIYQP